MMETIFLALIFMLPLMNHPLTLGFLVLILSSMSSVILCKLVLSWFGYSLFLVYVGGVLVMFTYVVALSPNMTKFNFNYLGIFFILVCVNSFILMQMKLDLYSGMTSLFEQLNLKNMNVIGGLFNNSNTTTMFYLLIMLMVTMIMVVKICYYQSAPLRPFN